MKAGKTIFLDTTFGLPLVPWGSEAGGWQMRTWSPKGEEQLAIRCAAR
jgi:hypothetical protein